MSVNNNKYEIGASPCNKRKRSLDCSNVFMNPALDLLATEDPICNTTMEIVPAKRTRRSRSCDDRTSFENPALDLGYQKKDIRSLLWKELKNVNEKLTTISEIMPPPANIPIHNNSDYSLEEKSIQHMQCSESSANQNSTPVTLNNFPMRRSVSFDLSFIEKLDLDDVPNEGIYFDDDLNESNIMEVKTITTIALRRSPRLNTNPFLSNYMENDNVDNLNLSAQPIIKGNFPFDLPLSKPSEHIRTIENNQDHDQPVESSYEVTSDVSSSDAISLNSVENQIVARRLFNDDTYDIYETLNRRQIDPSFSSQIQSFQYSTFKDHRLVRSNLVNKQSKILGFDVSNITRNEIFDNTDTGLTINQFKCNHKTQKKENIPSTKNDHQNGKSKKNGKISSKIFNKIKDAFKHEKKPHKENVISMANPYEVVRPKEDKPHEKTGFENPALNLNSTDIEFEEIENESPQGHFAQQNPYQVTPLKKVNHFDKNYQEIQNYVFDDADITDIGQQSTLKKHVRFDTTLNHEKVITGSSFDSDTPSISSDNRSDTNASNASVLNHIDNEIDEYHNELENCFNERKLISQNL